MQSRARRTPLLARLPLSAGGRLLPLLLLSVASAASGATDFAPSEWASAPLAELQASVIDLTQNPTTDWAPDALLAYAESATRSVPAGDATRLSLAQALSCRAYYRLQRLTEAAEACAAAVRSARLSGDPTSLAVSLRGTALLEVTAGRAGAAGILLAEAEAAAAKSGHRSLVAAIAVYSAIAAELAGLDAEATAHYSRAYDLSANSPDKSAAILAATNLGMWHVMKRQPAECLRRVEDGLRLSPEGKSATSALQVTRAQCLVLAGRAAEAEASLRRVEAAASPGDWVLRSHVQVALAQALIALRRPGEAVVAARRARTIAAVAPIRVAWANLTLAEALVADGRSTEALTILRALDVDTLGIADGRVDALTRLGQLLQERGEYAAAARFLSLALTTNADAQLRRSREMLAFLNARLDGDRQRAELALLQTKNAASQAEARRASLQRNGVIVVAVLLLTVGALWWRTRVAAQVQVGLSRELAERQQALDEQARRRRVMEQELDHKRRLEALGRLTAGVAHDFNNLMAVVLQVAGQLRRRPSVVADAHAVTLVDEACLAARTGGDITRQLLAFGGRQTLRPARVEMGAYLDSIRSLLDSSAAPGAQLRVAAPAALPATVVDRAGLTAALINLVANARNAIAARPGAGSIELVASVCDLPPGDPDWPLMPPGRYLVLAVNDDGCGMSPEVLEKCVEPFFSTGDAREGGGLGLSMVQGFARQSGGDLRIRSTPGAGTQLALLLPAVAA